MSGTCNSDGGFEAIYWIYLRNAGSSQDAEPDGIAAFGRGRRVEAAPETTNHGHFGGLVADLLC